MNAPVTTTDTTSTSPALTSPNQITEAQVRSYVNDDGFLIVRNIFTRDEINELFADIIKLVRGGYECPQLKPAPAAMSDAEVMQSFSGPHRPHFISPVVLRYIRHPKVCGVLSQIVAAHLPFWDGSVKCMQSMVFVKPPGLPGQAWHQDETYF